MANHFFCRLSSACRGVATGEAGSSVLWYFDLRPLRLRLLSSISFSLDIPPPATYCSRHEQAPGAGHTLSPLAASCFIELCSLVLCCEQPWIGNLERSICGGLYKYSITIISYHDIAPAIEGAEPYPRCPFVISATDLRLSGFRLPSVCPSVLRT